MPLTASAKCGRLVAGNNSMRAGSRRVALDIGPVRAGGFG